MDEAGAAEGERQQEWTNVRDMIRNFEMMKRAEADPGKRTKDEGLLGLLQKDTTEEEESGEKDEGEEKEGQVVPNKHPRPKSVARLLRQHQVTSMWLPEDSSGDEALPVAVHRAEASDLSATSQESVNHPATDGGESGISIATSEDSFCRLISDDASSGISVETSHDGSEPESTSLYLSPQLSDVSIEISHDDLVISDTNTTEFNSSNTDSSGGAGSVSAAIPTVQSSADERSNSPNMTDQKFRRDISQGAAAVAHSPPLSGRPHFKPVPMISRVHHRKLTASKSLPLSSGSPELQRMRGKLQSKLSSGRSESEESSSDDVKLLLSPRTKFFVDTTKELRESLDEEQLEGSDPTQLLRKKLLSSAAGAGRPRPRSLPPGDLAFFPKSASLDPNWAPRPLRRMMVLHESCAYQFPSGDNTPKTPCMLQTPLVPSAGGFENSNSSVESLDVAQTQSRKSKVTRSVSTDSGLSLGAAHPKVTMPRRAIQSAGRNNKLDCLLAQCVCVCVCVCV